MTLLELREKIGYHALLLGAVALAASVTLAGVDGKTRSGIAAAEQRDLQQSLAQVLPEGFADNDLLKDKVNLKRADGSAVAVFRARLKGEAKGAVFQMSARGYADEVVVLIGVDVGGRILGVRVLKHKETPGLGDKIEIAKGNWIRSFEGRSLGDPTAARFGVKKDGGVFDQFAGATITPRAVVKAVREGLQFFVANQPAIFAVPGKE
ncbi:MAG: RnfABCDGE type electron transport complex subunit G [Rhodocyclaceae bacterium]|jgi:electron transport complex protein RnfG|nr:RnfABCDGE type electron transport complex subunit G [Rhodocyclaceae bacterium]